MPKKILFLVIIFSAVVIAIASVSIVKTRLSNEAPKEVELTNVKVGYLNLLSSALPLYLAQDEKYFEKRGVKAEGVELASANLAVEALTRGDIVAAPFISVFPYLSAEIVDPGKIKLFALSDFTEDNRFDALLIRPDSPIKSLQDLSGKKIAVFPGSTATAFIKTYLQTNKVDISKNEFVQLPPQSHLQALQSKSVDAAYSFEPTFTLATEEGGMKILDESIYAKLFNHTPIAAGMINTKFASENPVLAKKIIDAFNESYSSMRKKDGLARTVSQKYFKLTDKVTQNVGMAYMTGADSDLFNKFVDFVVSIGELKQKPDLSSIFYKP
ncbi:MAG: ABC transporter substrate-binding protein [Candidatus Berkelbacteria bacterium]|nr:ABC transporter substrate-binding protein [Candidatus Berkelbacteria bacterium]